LVQLGKLLRHCSYYLDLLWLERIPLRSNSCKPSEIKNWKSSHHYDQAAMEKWNRWHRLSLYESRRISQTDREIGIFGICQRPRRLLLWFFVNRYRINPIVGD
jgi:hypothetical protein